MRNKMMGRFTVLTLGLSMLGAPVCSGSVIAAENAAAQSEAGKDGIAGAAQAQALTQEELAAVKETTVFQDETSATGYSVKFCFTDPDFGTDKEAQRVRIYGEWGFSDPMHSTIWTGEYVSPWEWQDGYKLWFGTHTAPYYDMERGEDGCWSLVVPLPAGGYKYRFYIGGDVDADVNDVKGCYMSCDQNNVPYLSPVEKDPYTLSAHAYFTSYIYVPWDPEKQANTDRVDEQCPRDDGQTGTVFYEKATIAEGDFAGKESVYGVYLPYGYEENADEEYRILVMVHGGGESEPSWFNSGLVEILDNMIAEGRMEPTIVVTPSMNDFDRTDGQNMRHDYDRVSLDNFIADQILPYMEENYHVSSDKEMHAIGGCSNGGIQTWVAYFNHNEDYKYYIVQSGAEPAQSLCDIDYTREDLRDDVVMIGVSLYDNAGWNLGRPVIEKAYIPVYNMAKANLPFEIINEIQYGHGYPGWKIELVRFFDDYLWKTDAREMDVPEITPLPSVTYSDTLSGEQLYQAALLYREKGDFKTALTFMHEALARGCDNALVEMAAWYFCGKAPLAEGEDNIETATHLMDLATERGNAMAAYYWGLIYSDCSIPGLGQKVEEGHFEVDIDKAIEYYELSIELGYQKAYKFLGNMYYNGDYGVEQDKAKAVEYYAAGAEAGDFTCTHLYADCLYNGDGIEQDGAKAMELYQWLVDVKAHNKNDYSWAAYMLGNIYTEGTYVEQDTQKAQEYYELAAELGNKDAMQVLGIEPETKAE